MTAPGESTGPDCRNGLAGDAGLALACFAVYALCGQRTLHGTDSVNLVRWLHEGNWYAYPRHAAFLPLTCTLHAWLQPSGVSAVRTLLLTSAAGAAIGVFCLLRAARLLLPTGDAARWAALAVAVTPAWFFYATAVELHGLFAAGLGAAWWAFARWRVRPGVGRALFLGFVVGLAGALHGLGTLLTPMFVAFAAARRPLPWRTGARHALSALAAQLGTALVLSWSLVRHAGGQVDAALGWLRAWTAVFAIDQVPIVVWREVVAPFLPWSVVAVGGVWWAAVRPWSVWFGIAFAMHIPIAVLLLARPLQIDEHGAYLLPVAVPAAFAAAAMPRRWLSVLLATSATLAVLAVAPEWRARYDDDLVAGIEQLRRERPFMLLAGPVAEVEAVCIELEDQPMLDVEGATWGFLGQRSAGAAAPFSAWFDGAVAMFAAGGSPLFVTEGARDRLRAFPDDEVSRVWDDHVERAYVLEPVRRAGLSGWFLTPRPR